MQLVRDIDFMYIFYSTQAQKAVTNDQIVTCIILLQLLQKTMRELMMLEMRIPLVPQVHPATYRLDRTGMFCLKHLKCWCYSFKVC